MREWLELVGASVAVGALTLVVLYGVVVFTR